MRFILFISVVGVVGCSDPIPVLRIISTTDNLDGTLTVKYKLRIIDNSSCSLEVLCYEPNIGWMAATSGGGDGTDNLSAKDDWVEHTFVWKYADDLGPGVHKDVKISLTPYTETTTGKTQTAGPLTVGTPFVVASLKGQNTLAFIDPNTKQVIQTVATNDGPTALALSPDGQTLAVCNESAGTVSFIPVAQGGVSGEVPVGNSPVACAFHPTQPTLFVVCKDDNKVVILDTSTMTVADEINVGEGPADIAVMPTGNAAVVACQTASSLIIIDTNTYQCVSVLQTVAPSSLAITTDGNTLLVVAPDINSLLIYDTSDIQNPKKTVPVGSQPSDVAVTPDGSFAVCSNSDSNTVSIIDLNSLTVKTTVGVSTNPVAVCVSYDGKFAYVACYGSNRVDQVEIKSGKRQNYYTTGSSTHPAGVVALKR